MKYVDRFVLFSAWCDGWNRHMPVTVLIYDTGDADLHCQTGSHHREAIRYARKMFNNMGISVSRPQLLGPRAIAVGTNGCGLRAEWAVSRVDFAARAKNLPGWQAGI